MIAICRIPLLCAGLVSQLHADLLAHFHTTIGKVDVILQHEKTPQTVANFIALSEGSRDRLNVATGALSRKPFYIGEKFFRIVNDSTFKIAQTGSGNGTNMGGGPGYTIKDEFHPALTHVPYVLSMANSGPNTNGSQIFLTGNATIPSLDKVHTVFGIITDPASRSVIDAIHAAGNDGTTITNLTFSRTDAAAVAFNEFAHDLPVTTRPSGNLQVTRGVAATWNLNSPISTGTIFRAFRSLTLGNWAEIETAKLHVGITPFQNTPAVTSRVLDNASAPSAFYQIATISHGGSVSPSTLSNRIVEIVTGSGVLRYPHNAAATNGTGSYTPNSGAPLTFSFNSLSFNSGAHEFSFIAENVGITPRYLLIKVGCDLANETILFGHHSTSQFINNGWSPFDKGNTTVTR